jgi:cysteine desulfurase/selenocysteine lyase
MLGPMGIGALYAKKEVLDNMEPLITGGDMIRSVTHKSYSWNDLPWKFEAGTSDVAGAVGFGAAIDYLNMIGMSRIRKHEKEMTKYALEQMGTIKNVKTFGLGVKDLEDRCGIIAFSIKGVHPHDVSQILDGEGIAIRAGQHCAMPLVTEILNENALSRISFYIYNEKSEIDKVVDAISKVKKTFRID